MKDYTINTFSYLRLNWHTWSNKSVNHNIFSATLVITVVTLFVKIVTLGKDIIVADRFGLLDALDIYLIVILLPSFAVSVFAGAFYSSFAPTFIKIREKEGEPEARKLLVTASFFAFITLSVVCLIFYLLGSQLIIIVAPGFNADKIQTTEELYNYFLPFIPISGMALFWAAILNTHRRFFLVAVAPVMTPAVIMLVLYISGVDAHPEDLVFGTLIGAILEFFILSMAIYKLKYLYLSEFVIWNVNIKSVVKQYIPMIGGAILMSSTVLIDQSMASWLEPGSVSALNYGMKLTSLITGLGTITLGTAVLPSLSKLVAEGDKTALKNTIKTYINIIILVSLPLAIFAIIFSQDIVMLLFERGSFNTASTHIVAFIQQLYLIQVPFYIIGILGVRLISSFLANHILAWISLINLVVNIAGNYFLMKILGVAGIALSTSIVYILSMFMIYFIIYQEYKK